MRLIIIIALMFWCGTAFAEQEDCSKAWDQAVGRHYGEQSAPAYQQCRIANALEQIAEALRADGAGRGRAA